jgi:hypothetical protein
VSWVIDRWLLMKYSGRFGRSPEQAAWEADH